MIIAVCELCDTKYIPPAFLVPVYKTKEIRCGACFGGHIILKEYTGDEEDEYKDERE